MAANEQKGFIVYLDSYDMISMLSQEQKGALLDAMFSVYGCCERPEMDQATAITFVTIERYLKDNREKWLKTKNNLCRRPNSGECWTAWAKTCWFRLRRAREKPPS